MDINKNQILKLLVSGIIIFSIGMATGIFLVIPKILPLPCINSNPNILVQSSTGTQNISNTNFEVLEKLNKTRLLSGIVSQIDGNYIYIHTQTPDQINSKTFDEYKVLITNDTKISKISLRASDVRWSEISDTKIIHRNNTIPQWILLSGITTFIPANIADITIGAVISVFLQRDIKPMDDLSAEEIQFQPKLTEKDIPRLPL